MELEILKAFNLLLNVWEWMQYCQMILNEISTADKVIFPGVGAASAAMKMLEESGLDKIIPTLKQPVLGICLGMQLMCNSSEEGNTKGLGIFKVAVKRFSNDVKVPQMGWNTIASLKSDLFLGVKENEFMYLVHSFYAEKCRKVLPLQIMELNMLLLCKKIIFMECSFTQKKRNSRELKF